MFGGATATATAAQAQPDVLGNGMWTLGSEVALVVPESAAALMLSWGWHGVGIGFACVLLLIIVCTLCCAKMASGRRDSKRNGGEAYSNARAVSQEPGGGAYCRRADRQGGQDSDDEGSVFLAKECSDWESCTTAMQS